MTKRNEQMPYLAIRNWDNYQTAKRGAAWIKDYTEKEADLEYSRLTCFQRYVLDGLCRLRGRLGHNVPNDPKYVATALQIVPKERTHVPQAIHKLSANGFLVLCFQRGGTTRVEESRGKGEQIAVRDQAADSSDAATPSSPSLTGREEHDPKPSQTPKPVPSGYGVFTPPPASDGYIHPAFRKGQGSVPSPKPTPVPSAPSHAASAALANMADVRDWPDGEDRHGVSGERLRNCIVFQLDHATDSWYREKGYPTLSSLGRERYVHKIDADTPPGWHPGIKRKTKAPEPKPVEGLLGYKTDKPDFD